MRAKVYEIRASMLIKLRCNWRQRRRREIRRLCGFESQTRYGVIDELCIVNQEVAFISNNISPSEPYQVVFVFSQTATSQEDVIENLGIYIVSFDRPGYGESDLHPQ
ncbi:hypothetical protein RND71_038973 [Anisodus tanguticus]|uniref:Uncharacterized protein n=1 Tax=Anisodus tanguticus TaxID=243964 RepID=A0AAE1R3P6_9SOLA|nr:hypothetical protein RND71_038973 [Anisodus tanguticus]